MKCTVQLPGHYLVLQIVLVVDKWILAGGSWQQLSFTWIDYSINSVYLRLALID